MQNGDVSCIKGHFVDTLDLEAVINEMSLQLAQISSILESNSNSVKLTGDLGRLDFVSVLLASIGVMVAVFALYGFGYIKVASSEIAAKAAAKKADEVLQPYLKILSDMKDEMRDLKSDRNIEYRASFKSQADEEIEEF